MRGPFKPVDYGKVVLQIAVFHRLDGVLDDTKDAVLAKHEQFFMKMLENSEFHSFIMKDMFEEVYSELNAQ